MSQIIEHAGKIQAVDNGVVRVLITQHSACSGCHAKSACTAADSAEKIIEAVSTSGDVLKAGDDVIVFGQRSLGLKAVLLAFVIPFLLILVSLVILRGFMDSEALSGTIALSVLIPYYIILSFFKDKFTSGFRFYVKKQD